MDGHHTIVGTRWFNNRDGLVGVVAVEDTLMNTWKAYIGIAAGLQNKADSEHIADWGCSLSPQEAQAFFAFLDIARYKDH